MTSQNTKRLPIDFESILPFQVIALLTWPLGVVSSWKSALLVGVGVVVIAQFMILTRTFDRDDDRLTYFGANELYLVVSVAILLGLQFVSRLL